MKFSYFFITSNSNLKSFEQEKRIILEETFSSSGKIINRISACHNNKQKDPEFSTWISGKDNYLTTLDLSNRIFEETILSKKISYPFTVINELFCFHNLLNIHQEYCYIKHGYPISINIDIDDTFKFYTIYKEDEEFYNNVIIDSESIIAMIMNEIAEFSKIKSIIQNFSITHESILLLQNIIDEEE